MNPTQTSLDIEGARRFHGHSCPGLTMGIRVSEIALREIGPHSTDEEVVCITETDHCGVDAIQYLTGCALGKGNRIHQDHSKTIFTFIRAPKWGSKKKENQCWAKEGTAYLLWRWLSV